MKQDDNRRVAYACSYTPQALIAAAGLIPWRILPTGEAPETAGTVLHDNLCPHVKLIFDRANDDSVGKFAGVVLVDSCDAMRRLADAWRRIRPDEPVELLDLPVANDEGSIDFFAGALRRLGVELGKWSGQPIDDEALIESINKYNEQAELLGRARKRFLDGEIDAAAMQEVFNAAAVADWEQAEKLAAIESVDSSAKTPVYLFGNVQPHPAAYKLFADCGARIVEEDMCTSARMVRPIIIEDDDPYRSIASSLLNGPRCARTIDLKRPGAAAIEIAEAAVKSKASGVIAYTMKFCDPYLARMPSIAEKLKAEGLPLLVLEGDCSLRSLGQQQTRIEAFVEMIRDN